MVNTKNSRYIGRFAPSTTGPLHLGSLYAALASFLDARAKGGLWLLRIDDSDTPRHVSGATEGIINTLQLYGLEWDDSVCYQSNHQQTYQTIITRLIAQNLVYPCTCTRKALASNNSAIYPGFCLNNQQKNDLAHSLRIKSEAIEIVFDDELQGHQCHNIAQQHGDFIIKRKDNIIAYQLAVVIDDHLQNITHVVRGFDLLDSTPKQIFLQQILGYSTPQYTHVPVIIDKEGNKLSKQTFAQAVPTESPHKTLYLLLELLKQNPPASLKNTTVNEVLNWAIEHWTPETLKKIRAIN
ncbi:MAG: tRNA glutamyl-Q(34) synthetase GluQRS [Methylococcales bacterium]|nr:tRNA glutamyl-Q(34) synthetase GluQRS [Methylococcales bacterium]